jgi:lipopolysaccharide transport system ATP-binding protein
MSTGIAIENLSKKYIISHQKRERYFALRDVLANGAKRFTHKLIHPFAAAENDPTHEEFWALKDINFDIMQGDRVGIIGRNGAGKSTLLKILSRITEPTFGKITIKGRVASLLEVGTGFHPELTGRENIFLNGAVLGMSKVEINRKFDEIVAFAEVEKFLDTPVKRYSSGMYVRLSFAVAAHLEPEILIVDEVLAVGDAQFQKKCLGKMDEAGREGRTILFVSHNMGVISQLCSTCVWLDKGEIRDIGQTGSVVNSYMLNGISELSGEMTFPDDSGKIVQLKKIAMLDREGNIAQKFDCDNPINIKFDIQVRRQLSGLYGYIGIVKPDGTQVLVSDSFDAATVNPLDSLPVGTNTFSVIVPPRTLGHGDYMINFSMASQSADNFHVDVAGIVCGFSLDDFTSRRGNGRAGFFSTLLPWRKLEN